jgi:flavin-binding protein dodecin
MPNNVYSITELVGSSDKSLEDAIVNAVTTANKTLKNLDWFEVTQIRGHIEDGRVSHYQVGMKLGLRYERPVKSTKK